MAAQAGFTEGATLDSVAQAVIHSIKQGDFHLFPRSYREKF
ncbi:hypothetical protein [uncultured Shewanella sp.]|nr:hypothetical protein [uncultured Shewanella sp.]